MDYVVRSVLSMAGLLGYDIIVRDTVNSPAENAKYKTQESAILKQLTKNEFNDLILE